MNIKKFADLTGVSVRTLHYYDEIGLLKPDFVDGQNRYRSYGDDAMSRMQEILFYRELDFPLKTIKEILSSPHYDKKEALNEQKQLLIMKKERLEKIIMTIESAEKGENVMDFNAFSNKELELYKKEAKERWGNTDAFRESQEKTADYTDEKWNQLQNGLDRIFFEFAALKKEGVGAENEKSQALVEKLKNYITENQYNCTDEILAGLGEMYVADDRFKKYIDKFEVGTAEFVNRSINVYCNR